MPKFKFNRLQWLVHIGSIIPFIVLLWDAFSNNLTVNPIQEITQRTGRIAIIWLVLSLACTPLNIIFGLKPFNQVRRPLGLYAAFYACLHMLTFFILDYGLNWKLITQTIIEKPYILLGATGLLILILLTFTSTKKSMKKLGKKWNQIHRLVYPAAIILALHFFMALKFINTLAITIAVILVILFFIRIPVIRKFFTQRQPAWVKSVNNFLTGRTRKTIILQK
jgi:sulfoxide reductase heme-binding subunit YedZ